MKKLALTLAIILGIALGASAQNGGLFGKGPSRDMDYEYGTREGEGPMINLPGSHGTTNDESAPLGGGIALLTGLGAAYLVAKKRKNTKRGAMMALLALLAFGPTAWAQNNWDEVYALTQTTSANWAALGSGSTTGWTIGSAGNTTYYYATGNLSFTNSNDGGSGLTILGTVYLYIPNGVTVTCTGHNASGTTGAGAGVELAAGNTLYLLGGGTINATGGNAADGTNGSNGDNSNFVYNNYCQPGSGGAGGNGGGGGGGGAAGNSAWRSNYYPDVFFKVGAGGGSGGQNADGTYTANGVTSELTSPYNAEYQGGLTLNNYKMNYYEEGNGQASGGGSGSCGGASQSGSAINLVYWPTQGAGTEESPYLISSVNEWNTFVTNVSNGNSYSGQYVKLTNDISVTTMAGGYQDDDNYQPFSGIFDGDGHTLTLNVSNQSRFAAPFKCVSGATIRNLRTAGTIDGTGNADGKLLAGIIGVSFGNTTITGCRSSVTLTTAFGEDAALAGLVAGTKGGSLTIEGCVFDGSMTGSSNTRCAGIAGFEYTATTTTISNCLFTPTTLTVSTTDDNFTKTFTRDGDATLDRCYYTQTLGAAQGTQATVSASAPATLGSLLHDYGMVKAYAGAILFNGNYYYDANAITSESTSLSSGTYTVYTDVEVPSRITISGSVTINLAEGATLHAPKGIDVSIGNSLIINGPGTLTIDGCDSDKAGIGAENVGTLTINGGIINARGGTHGAGIGGNMYNVGGGTITINGGIVNANGGYGAAGIGGGVCGGTANYGQGTGMCGNVYIYGGQVTAVGGDMAAGIGPGVCTSISVYPPISGKLTIGWTNPEDFLYSSGFYSQNGNYNATLSDISFVEGKQFIIEGLGEIANPSLPTNFGSRKILPLIDQATALPGSGSLSDPYRISNLSDWMKLAVNVNGGTKNYSGEYVRLENDLSVSIMVGKDETNSFQGTFLGNNKTLTFSYSTWEENTAPFRVTNNATIKDLKVAGSISTSAKFAAGLASRTFGTTSITNCQVDTYIHSNINGDGTHGGIVAMPSGTLNIEGCAFTGRLLTNKGTHSCGGFVGWHNSSTISVINSLYAPSSSIPSGWSAITGGATFVRGGSAGEYCYYTEKLGDVQGSLVFVYPSDPGNLGNVVQAYSTLTAYTNGIFCDDIYYLKAATFSGAGNEGSPYLISNEFEWKSFAAYVNSGSNTYSGKYMKLTADISVTEMVGSSEGNSFQGTFLGDGVHTLTFTQGTSESAFNEQNCAPFRYVNGATIRDLKVAGYIYTSQKFAAGLVSRPYGTTNITNCQVSTVIYSSVSGDGTHGGIVAMPASNTNIEGCVYTGHLLTNNGSINCGGFVGWYNNATVSATNSLYVPSGSIADGWSAITDGVTFVRGGSPTINNCYYTETLGTEQGKMVYTITTTVPTNLGTLKADYSMLKAYTNGILYDGTYYVTRALNGTGTEGSPYIIADADDWGTFVYNVNNGFNNYNGEFVRLDANINISQTVGLRDNKPFSGTFLGNDHTITASINSTTTGTGANEQGVAPFHYINGATIKDLKVAGTIASASYHTSGLVGFANGTNTIENCLVTATINISSNYAGGIIGHGQSSNTTIRGCVFAGTINGVGDGRENIGGIWGWSNSGTPTLEDCLEAGTYTNIASMHPMGLQKAAGTITGCYYVNPQVGSPANVCTVSGAAPGNARMIAGYGEGNDKWAFIASPLTANTDPTTVQNLISASEYDLYQLNPGTMMWENYKQHEGNAASGFSLENGRGYLYATQSEQAIKFSGANASAYNLDNTKEVTLQQGFNLVGNPFPRAAYINRSYYTLNSDGSAVSTTPSTEYIPPCHAVVVEATNSESLTFSTKPLAQQSTGNNGGLQIALSQTVATRGGSSMNTIDNAIVSFNEGMELGKFYFGNQNANIYIPQGNKDYAIVSVAGRDGACTISTEIPVNFKAKENGTYTLTVNPEGVEMAYLHLIDNLAGTDIDLLATPSHTFTARNDDYESRFRLVFVANNADLGGEGNDDFAFISNGQLILTSEGTLQVVDMMGRVISTEVINGTSSKAINAKAGVYVLRLMNGENVKTQKIVVR